MALIKQKRLENMMSSLTNVYRLNTPQRLFIGYTLAVLVDLTVLNFFAQYWDKVYIESFSISFCAALLLQLLLKLSIKAEYIVAKHFRYKQNKIAKVQRILATWGILFGSKIIMLEAIDWLFGAAVEFNGLLNGLLAFIAVIVSIMLAEITIGRIYFALDKHPHNW